MKGKFLFVIVGTTAFLVGILFTGVLMWNLMPTLMLQENKVNMSFDEATVTFENSVKKNGWKIPAVHDMKKTMNNFGKDVKNIKVFEICHPGHAYKILSKDQERIVSSMMPCRIAIYEKSDGNVYLSRMNTGLISKMMKGVVPEVMNDASVESEAIIASLLK